MGGQLATGSSIYMASAGVPAADGAGLSSIKSFSQLLTSIAAMPLAGGTFIGHVLFTDNTYDIGASGATRPRTVYAGTSVITPLLNNSNAAALTLGNSTYGISSPGRITASGGITSPHASYPNTSEQFGYGAAAGDLSVSVGRNASSGGNAAGVAVGYGATSDYSSVSLGYSATAGWLGVAIGANAITFDGWGYGAIAIGKSSQGLHDGSIALGYGAITSAANQLVLGAVTVPITQQRFMTGGGSLTFANETGTFLTVANAGAATFSGDISMQKATQGYIRAYGTGGVNNIAMYDDNTNGILSTSSGDVVLSPATNAAWCNGTVLYVYKSGSQSSVRAYDSSGTKYIQITHDATNGTVGTTAGNLNLVPAGGTVAVTGAVTASGTVTVGTYTVATLPAAGSNAYSNANVSDSNAAASGNYGATVAGGGSNKVRVFSDGTNWVIA